MVRQAFHTTEDDPDLIVVCERWNETRRNRSCVICFQSLSTSLILRCSNESALVVRFTSWRSVMRGTLTMRGPSNSKKLRNDSGAVIALFPGRRVDEVESG